MKKKLNRPRRATQKSFEIAVDGFRLTLGRRAAAIVLSGVVAIVYAIVRTW
jgi:hypothetical protein